VTATRTLVVDCPDWPVVASGAAPDEPAAVFHANRAVATSAAARNEGVEVGMRRREAQGRCPSLAVLAHDPSRDARAFEAVAAAVQSITPRLELTRPGRCAFPTRGPARYFGGDDALAARVRALAQGALGDRGRATVGIADGPFAAALAAERSLVVPPGASPAFLAPFALDALALPELVDVLRRLGIRTLGDLAALPPADVLARFGTAGATARRLATGLDERPPATTPPPPELAVQIELDPPAERVEQAAFVARALADELHQRLHHRGLACTRLLIVAETEHGESHERLWRHEGALTTGAIADRARWQLDGWLNGSAAHRPTSGITLLRLAPDEVVPATGRQLGFWGGDAGADERALRALARIEGLLGPEAVTVPEWRGGRLPGEQIVLIPAAAVDLTIDRSAGVGHGPAPWPGHLPAPAPATVPHEPMAASVLDERGEPVRVSGRGGLSASPARLVLGPGGRPRTITAWAGPWPVEERWWDPPSSRRRARFQVVTDDGVARLVVLESGHWTVTGLYD
jgi:protein ImuB